MEGSNRDNSWPKAEKESLSDCPFPYVLGRIRVCKKGRFRKVSNIQLDVHWKRYYGDPILHKYLMQLGPEEMTSTYMSFKILKSINFIIKYFN